MDYVPVIRTNRLILRPMTEENTADFMELAGEEIIARRTVDIQHPMTEAFAESMISQSMEGYLTEEWMMLGIELREDGRMIGGIQLVKRHFRYNAELGFWIGLPYWNNGYATEAAEAIVAYGFQRLYLLRIHATCFPDNLGSIRVLEKTNFKWEAYLKEYILHDAELHDQVSYRILRSEWNALRSHSNKSEEEASQDDGKKQS